MGGDGFLGYVKAEARAQGQVSGGKTAFMQTGEDRLEALHTVRFLGGPGRHAVIVDVLPILIFEHRRIEKERPQWLRLPDLARVLQGREEREAEVLGNLEGDIRRTLGSDTLIVFVVDGALRPEAKKEEMTRRSRRTHKRLKEQKPLPCGKKEGAVLDAQRTSEAWKSNKHPQTIWLEAHDEADLLIGHIVSAAHAQGSNLSTPTPDHPFFEAPEVLDAVGRLAGIATVRRTIITRDSDLAACNVGTDTGFFLFLEWHGKLDKVTLQVDGAVAPAMPAGGPSRGSTSTRAGPPPPPTLGAGRPFAPVPGVRRGAAGATAAAQPRQTRGGKIPELPNKHGNYLLLRASGLDALAALGSDRSRRVRVWSLCGNDYLRRGVYGITYNVIASGLLDDLVSRPFSAPSFSNDLTNIVSRLASPLGSDQSWRGGGARGRVRKIDRAVLAEDIFDKLIESERIGSGMKAHEYISADSRLDTNDRLDYADLPPHVERSESDPPLAGPAPPATHPFAARPDDPDAAPTPSSTNPRRLNPVQPRRPNEDGSNKPSKCRIRPRAPGESIFNACTDYGPEPIEINEKSLQKERDARAKEEEARAIHAKQEQEWKEKKEKRQKAREEEGDDETEVREGTGKSALNGLESVYQLAMSHEEPISAVFRDFTAASDLGPPVATPPQAVNPNSRHRSSAQQRRAQQERLTTPKHESSPAKPDGKVPPRPSAAANTRTPELPPPDVASMEPMADFVWLGMQLSLGPLTAGYRALTMRRLDKGEAGAKFVSDAAVERDGIAREHGRLSTFDKTGVGGKNLSDNAQKKRELSEAAAAAGATDYAQPPRMPMSTYTQAYLPLQTAIKQLSDSWITDDLHALGSYIATDPIAHVPLMLQYVFRRSHETFTFSAATTSFLNSLANAPDAASRFTSSLSDLLGRMLRDTPYSDRCSLAGTAEEGDQVVSTGSRQSLRGNTMKSSRSSKAAMFGFKSSVKQVDDDEDGRGEKTTTPATAVEAFSAADREELESITETAVARSQEEEESTPLAAGTSSSVVSDLLEIAFRVVCFRDRHVELALNLSGCRQVKECVGKTIEQLLGGRAPLSAEKFNKSLLALTVTLRRMQSIDEARLLPFYDPTWINVSIVDLLRLSQPDHLLEFLSSLEQEVTEAVHLILPILQDVDDHGADLLAFIRERFSLQHANGDAWDWRDAERAGGGCANNDAILGEILSSKVRVRPHLRTRVEAISPSLQQIFDTDAVIGSYIEQHHAKAEVINIIARRSVQAQDFVPTGMIQLSPHHVRFCGVKVNRVDQEYKEAAAGLDVGRFWSRTAQKPWSQLNLADYYAAKHPAYEVRRGGAGWATTEIRPIAVPSEAEMNADRDLPAPVVNFNSIPRHLKARLQSRMAKAAKRSASRTQSPSQLRTPIKEQIPPERTRDGLPISWGSITSERTRDGLKTFVSGREPSQIGFAGVDLGVRNPVAMYTSTPSTAAGVQDGYAEATVIYGRERLLALEQRNSEKMAHIHSNLTRQLDRSRFSDRAPPRPRPPDRDVALSTWIDILKKAHPVRDRIQVRYRIERDAEIRAVAHELGDAVAGGRDRARAELDELKFVIFVGDEMTVSNQHGATSHNVIIRKLASNLRQRHISAMFVRTPENYTSKRCPNPRCREREDEEARSRAMSMRKEDGTAELRLLRCERCGCIVHRDGAAACNMIAMGVCWWWYGVPLWGAGIDE